MITEDQLIQLSAETGVKLEDIVSWMAKEFRQGRKIGKYNF